MSIWNDPDITFVDFAKYVSTESNKSALAQLWSDKTKHKDLLSELQPHELSDVLIAFMTQCIKSKNPTSSPTPDQLHDASDLFTDWMIENKLSGIPSSDDEDYNKMKLAVIFSKNLLSGWISEASVPLKSYVDSKNEHNPSLSQQAIAAKNKKLRDMHPSLAHLFEQKIVNKQHNEFNDYRASLKQREQDKYAQKEQEATQNIHQIRQSRALLYFNHSDVGYEVKKKCKIYKDEKLSEVLVELEKGELMGGKKENEKLKIVELVEPIKGYVRSKYVKAFELDSSQWKFLQHQRSMTTNISMDDVDQSMTLRIHNDDLLLPDEEDEDEDDDDSKMQSEATSAKKKSASKRKVKFSGAYNENEDEKKIEDNPTSYNDPVKSSKLSYEEKRLRKCKENVSTILGIKKSKRTPQQVLDLWTAGFNLHDLSILKKCYSPQVSSQQFVNQELNARDPILQCFKQMFEASDDVGLEVTNCILKDGAVILEFRTFGSRKGDARSSPTNSHNGDHPNGLSGNGGAGGGAGDDAHNQSSNYLASPPTKSGLPTKMINGVGIFQVNNGEITGQRLFWDQDQQWFADMNVIKMPQNSTLSHFLYKNKLAPILNLTDEHLDSSSNGSDEVNGVSGIANQNGHGQNMTFGGDQEIWNEMNVEMNELLALRGLNLSDLVQYEDKTKLKQQSRQKQMAQAMFWIAVGAMFVFIVPKYLGKPKR